MWAIIGAIGIHVHKLVMKLLVTYKESYKFKYDLSLNQLVLRNHLVFKELYTLIQDLYTGLTSFMKSYKF